MLKDSQSLVLLPPTAAGHEKPGGNTQRSRGQAGPVHPSLPNLCRGLTWEGSPCPQWFLPVLKGNSLNVVLAAAFTHVPAPSWQTWIPGGSDRVPPSFPPAPGKIRGFPTQILPLLTSHVTDTSHAGLQQAQAVQTAKHLFFLSLALKARS